MAVRTLGLLCALLLVTVSGSQTCAPRPLPDMVIDISDAVARGARFTDPLRVGTEEECVSACCREQDRGGDRDCNLLVFDARKDPGLQNCYIFHCPTLNSCPLTNAPGVISYTLWSEPSHLGKHIPDRGQPKSSDRSKVPKTSDSTDSGPLDHDSKKPIAAITSQGSAKHHAKEEAADTSESLATKLLHLGDKIDQRLETMESKSEDDRQGHYSSSTTVTALRTTTIPLHREVKKVSPNPKAAKPSRVTHKKLEDVKIYFPTEAAPTPGRTLPRFITAAPKPGAHTLAGLPAHQDVSGSKTKPKLPGGDHAANEGAAMASTKKGNRPLTQTESPDLTSAHQIMTRPVPLRTSLRKAIDDPSTGEKGETPGRAPPETNLTQEPVVNLEEAPRSGSALPSIEDRSGLVAALVFGMLFLMVVIGLVSRKVSEARRRHRYTKLDYLINGMYVDT